MPKNLLLCICIFWCRHISNVFFTKWVQNRPFDILKWQIDMKFYARSHGSNQNTQNTHQKPENEEKHRYVPAPKFANIEYMGTPEGPWAYWGYQYGWKRHAGPIPSTPGSQNNLKTSKYDGFDGQDRTQIFAKISRNGSRIVRLTFWNDRST